MKHSLHHGAGLSTQQHAGWPSFMPCSRLFAAEQNSIPVHEHHNSGSRSMARTMKLNCHKGTFCCGLLPETKLGRNLPAERSAVKADQSHNSLSEDCVDGRLPGHQLSMRPADSKGASNLLTSGTVLKG